jgi:hypothetical protein
MLYAETVLKVFFVLTRDKELKNQPKPMNPIN